ncbi:MAG: 23S rRNA (uracil(1939)-C(5))-methyltransferase RlmD [Clostridium sp.]|nr:23S rRNA (uracil(1939)-C(5))-methyltransferase RlmD [Clostridium sp.]
MRAEQERETTVQSRKNGRKAQSGQVGRSGQVGQSRQSGRNAQSGQSGDSLGKPRRESQCPVSKRCGGCTMIDMPYPAQLERKQRQIEELLKGICPKIHKIKGMKEPLHYRHKVHAVFSWQKGRVVSGIYEEGTHRVIPVDSCLLEQEMADAIIRDLCTLITQFRMKVYDEDSGYGLFRHALIRVGLHSGEVMVVLVLASPILPSKNHFVKALRELHPEITTIVLNVNAQRTSMVLGERMIPLYGKGYIEDQLCGCTFRISPSSFYQVNPRQTELLYQKAVELAGLHAEMHAGVHAGPHGKRRVLDAYCGTGTIGIIAAKQAGEVIGVELNRDAVKDAAANAKRNQVSNIRFYQADAGELMTQMAKSGEKADVVILDPPRSGSTEAFIKAVRKLSPPRVVYISCNPETLARDLQVFRGNGYRAKEAFPYDMFPFTGHVECVVLMTKVQK